MKKSSIGDVKQSASTFNVYLKDGQVYQNIDTKLIWICSTGHEFVRTYRVGKIHGFICRACNPKIPHNKNKKLTGDSTRKKISESGKGRIPYNKGISLPIETKIKLSCANRNMQVQDFVGFADRKKRALDYSNNRYKTDIQYALAKRIRNRVFKRIKGDKPISTADAIGCSLHELKTHIESLWIDDMNWENYGAWHIDHIKPLKNFDLTKEEQFREACNFMNMRPAWKFQNLWKGSKDIKKCKVYLLTGNFGSGKTHLASSLPDIHFISYDNTPNVLNSLIQSCLEYDRVILDMPILVSTFMERYGAFFNYELIVLDNKLETTVKNVVARGGKTNNLAARQTKIEKLKKVASFVGTSEQIIDFLKR